MSNRISTAFWQTKCTRGPRRAFLWRARGHSLSTGAPPARATLRYLIREIGPVDSHGDRFDISLERLDAGDPGRGHGLHSERWTLTLCHQPLHSDSPHTLCMPGYPPRHVCAADRRFLLTYLLTGHSLFGHQARRRGSLLSCPLSQAMTVSPLLRCPRTPPPHRLRIAEQLLLAQTSAEPALVYEVPHSAARLSTWRRVVGRPRTCVCAARLWERQPPARAR